ncbi:hypothetical protein GCM10009575_049010 [Streptomyces rhizosphaericus]|uniref:ABC transporter domain-containing protein n=1 Tax=Streptomyces rhizosphaericus TaxID=114699 RepID=A0ABN1Q499_9ACTN
MRPRSPLEATRTGIGVVHQERNLIPGFSVAENITLQSPPSHRGLIDRAAMTDPALRCLGELGLDLDPDRPIRELSVARQQLVEIAKALYAESRVLLLEIVGLYGLVGAGRSELVKAVLGLDRVTGGEIRVHGEPVRIASPRQALHRFGIGYLTENRKEEGLFLDQPIARNITVTVWKRPAKALGFISAREERDVAYDLVERLGIRIAGLDRHAGELSGGNQQKMSLAKWLAADTRLLIVDEPTVGVDVRTKHAFHELIWELARDGLPILLISSDLAEMITLADRVVVMADHRIRGELDNDRDYERMSGRIIRIIHDRATSAVRPRAVEA